MNKLKAFGLVLMLVVGAFVSRVEAQVRAEMVPHGTTPESSWVSAWYLGEHDPSRAGEISWWGFDHTRTYYDYSTCTFYLVEHFPGEVLHLSYYVNVDYLTSHDLYAGGPAFSDGGEADYEPDFSADEAARAAEQAAWYKEIAATDAARAQRIAQEAAEVMLK